MSKHCLVMFEMLTLSTQHFSPFQSVPDGACGEDPIHIFFRRLSTLDAFCSALVCSLIGALFMMLWMLMPTRGPVLAMYSLPSALMRHSLLFSLDERTSAWACDVFPTKAATGHPMRRSSR